MTGELVADEKGRRGVKSATAFRTISEVASDLSVPSHVLRFWETKFSQVRPLKRGGGRRYYRPEDVDLLRNIRTLLYDSGYTIKGVQKLLREGRALSPLSDADSSKKNSTEQADHLAPMAESRADKQLQMSATTRGVLSDLLRELEELRKILRRG